MNKDRMGISSAFLRGGGFKVIQKQKLIHTYDDIISIKNLCLAWEEFIIGKKKKTDVTKFSQNLMDNIIELHDSLINKAYFHGGYESFFINDPKRRHIHKASVRDRLLHHAIYRILYPFFDQTFIADSYSCRDDKGTHRAINRLRAMCFQVSKNNTRTCWVLKCDIRKFFDSIDQQTLLNILTERIPDKDIVSLLANIIGSFGNNHIGLPLGNLTSQLFANVYLNRFDQWVKHRLKIKHYIRYADDFVFIFDNKNYLESLIPLVQTFLQTNLKLTLHPNKLFLKTMASGVDFLGWVNFPNHRVLRTKTKQRMFRNMRDSSSEESLQSYLGLLSHGNTGKIRERLLMENWIK